jgi:hypothetical protein
MRGWGSNNLVPQYSCGLRQGRVFYVTGLEGTTPERLELLHGALGCRVA